MSSPTKSLFLERPPEGCSIAYRNLFVSSNRKAQVARETCEALWGGFHDLADANFVERMPFEFHQRWFEMYLGATLRDAGLDVSAPKPGPDFRVILHGRPTYIEAIAPTPGHPLHPDTVQEPVYADAEGNPIAARVPHTQITLRLADAFRRKADVFDGYRRKEYVEKDAACIIAINLRDIPQAWADAEEFWFRALYGVGDRIVVIDRAGGATTAGRDHRTLLNRAGGAVEDVAPLLNADRAGISGVLGSAADVGNIPTPIGDEFLLMPHASPLSPYQPGFIRRGAEVALQADTAERWTVHTTDYGAHPTRGPENLVVEFQGHKVEVEWAVSGRVLSVRMGRRGCDVNIQGGEEPATTATQVATAMIRAYGVGGPSAEREAT